MGGMLRNGPDGLRAGRDLFEDLELIVCHTSSEHTYIGLYFRYHMANGHIKK